jgi:hypothetical protein
MCSQKWVVWRRGRVIRRRNGMVQTRDLIFSRDAILLARPVISARLYFSLAELSKLWFIGYSMSTSILALGTKVESKASLVTTHLLKPLSVAIEDVDMALSGPLILKMKDILENKSDDHGFVITLGAKHGSAIRTDPDISLQMEYADKAGVQAGEWFSKWFV